MPGTKISLVQILVADPRHPHDEDRDHAVLVPHVKGGTVQVVNAQFAGGGRNEWALDILVCEPLTDAEDKQVQKTVKERTEKTAAESEDE